MVTVSGNPNPTTLGTEVLWCSSARRRHWIPTRQVRVSNSAVLPQSAVRDRGVCIDADVTMSAHVELGIEASAYAQNSLFVFSFVCAKYRSEFDNLSCIIVSEVL